MKIRKLLLGLLVMIFTFGLFACGNDNPTPDPKPDPQKPDSGTSFGNLEDGLYTNYVDANTFTATRTETRENAYTAYKPDGTKIADCITIAEAINKCVDFDVEYNSDLRAGQEEVYGSYVTRIDSNVKLFKNKKGFQEANDDQFWYYENGKSLAAYNCWDNSDSILTLRNTNLITHKISGYGTVSQQTWNSYELLDAFGETITDLSAQSWELSSTMDAAVLQFPQRLAGITGMKHTIDMSGVSIVPPYDGADSTYAFIGYYAWQDYYVIAIGIACDTRTGNWYPFIGTSRDDSFSDVEYNLGKCLFTSKWENGAFKPNVNELEIKINTVKMHDEQEDEDYQVDDFKVICDGKQVYERHITDSLVNSFFSGNPLSWENGYVFIAGLDIKNQIVQSQFVENTDYFNGSSFTGLKVTSALAYVPTVEELDDVDYGFIIDPEWRGKWHDILMANSEDTADVLDYSILNTCVCASYRAVNGADVYSFSYDANNASSIDLGLTLLAYQGKIDALANVTLSDILNDSSLLDEVGSWLVEGQTIVPQKYFLCLDFTHYYTAKELLEAASMSDEAKAVVAQIQALEPTQYVEFEAIINSSYAALTADEKNVVRLAVGAKIFDNLQGLSEFVQALNAVSTKFVTFEKVLYFKNGALNGASGVEMTAKEAFDQLVKLAKDISEKVKYTDIDMNDDSNDIRASVMNGDNHFFPSMRIVAIVEYFEGLKLELPGYVKDLLETIAYDDFYQGFYYPVYNTVKLAVSLNGKTSLSQLSEEEVKFLNEVWVSTYSISAQINWNWNSGNKFEMFYDGRTRAISILAGGDGSIKVNQYFALVGNFLTSLGYTLNSNGWGVTAAEIK